MNISNIPPFMYKCMHPFQTWWNHLWATKRIFDLFWTIFSPQNHVCCMNVKIWNRVGCQRAEGKRKVGKVNPSTFSFSSLVGQYKATCTFSMCSLVHTVDNYFTWIMKQMKKKKSLAAGWFRSCRLAGKTWITRPHRRLFFCLFVCLFVFLYFFLCKVSVCRLKRKVYLESV